MAEQRALIPPERIERRILLIRREKVILDADLAALYGVATKRLNEQVKRNRRRFPSDFVFALTPSEVRTLNRSQSATGSQKHRDPRFPPFAFTEHGAVAAAFVLNTPVAVAMSVQVVRAFVHLRRFAGSHAAVLRALEELERRVTGHDRDLKALFAAIHALMDPPTREQRGRIGFTRPDEKDCPPA
jgi:hypothetical protein